MMSVLLAILEHLFDWRIDPFIFTAPKGHYQ